ncbi:MAG: UDP-N-acetylmuramate--L-alanine ligase [Clostridia bacterium]|nr:UDP-N-acetylmuramate--L-alanine ligase [Clostridia bacterium]
MSVSALAEYSLAHGIKVSGSDLCQNFRTDKLKDLGANIKIGHTAKHLSRADAVVYTVATDENNSELRYAKKKKLPVFTRAEFLGEIIDEYKNSVAVSGCHGKTTTTAMIANVLICANKNPTVFLGGDSLPYGNFRLGKSDCVVAEACEYKKSFLNIKPKIAVVLNVGDDHLDTYGNVEGVIKAFNSFIGDSIAVVNADDENAKKVFNASTVNFGINNTAHYYATDIKRDGEFYSFTLNAYSRRYGRIKLKTLGKHNIYNALATFATCDLLGVSFSKIKKGLEEFCGVKRRNEYLGEKYGVKFFADYAHHPEELKATLSAYKENGQKILTVFQPHTYSRTKLLMSEFLHTLNGVNPLIICKTYPARELYDESGCAHKLYENLKKLGNENVYYADDDKSLFELIKRLCLNTDVVLILGAGDVYEKAVKLIETNQLNVLKSN